MTIANAPSTTCPLPIRVFARRTKWTPDDSLAFFDGPPLWPVGNGWGPVLVSVAFTWDIERGLYLVRQWKLAGYSTTIGGPALNDPGGEFTAGMFVKDGVTITSRGCPKHCSFCMVPKREGKIRELAITPGHVVQDNNLLACSRRHIKAVFEMLRKQKKAIKFLGGLDIGYMKPWHIELFKSVKIGKSGLCIACDSKRAIRNLDKAADLLSDFDIEQKRCYVLVGYKGETQDQAQQRCITVLRKGFLPYAQLYRGPTSGPSRREWRDFCYFWCHPKLYRPAFEK